MKDTETIPIPVVLLENNYYNTSNKERKKKRFATQGSYRLLRYIQSFLPFSKGVKQKKKDNENTQKEKEGKDKSTITFK